jgi:hypothetical protein
MASGSQNICVGESGSIGADGMAVGFHRRQDRQSRVVHRRRRDGRVP